MAFNTQITQKIDSDWVKTQGLKSPSDLCEELLQKYGITLYEILWFEDGINDTQIFEKIQQVLEQTCEQVNSPSLLPPKISVFFNVQCMITNLNSNKNNLYSRQSNTPILSNIFVHALKQLSFEQRFYYLLKVKENFSYRDFEVLTLLNRENINYLLTDTRELLRSLLANDTSLPFSIHGSLCETTHHNLSSYLDNEVNILQMLEIEKHLSECDTCLKILANHQHIQKQIEKIHIISKEELLNNFHSESTLRKKKLSESLEKKQNEIETKKKKGLFHRIWYFLKGTLK